jgi:hypothetical protein
LNVVVELQSTADRRDLRRMEERERVDARRGWSAATNGGVNGRSGPERTAG